MKLKDQQTKDDLNWIKNDSEYDIIKFQSTGY